MTESSKPAVSTVLRQMEDRLLQERIRLTVRVCTAAVVALIFGEYYMYGAARPKVHLVQGSNVLVLGATMLALRRPVRRATMLGVGLVSFVVTAVAIALCGVIAHDATSPLIAFLGMALGTATLVPWGAGYQLIAATVVGVCAVATVLAVVEQPGLFWLQHLGSVLPTFAVTVYVAHEIRRARILSMREQIERERREEALRESEERFRTMFDTAGIGIALCDIEGRMLQSNPFLETMIGYSAGELREVPFTRLIHPDDLGIELDALRDALNRGRGERYEVERRYLHKEGKIVWGRLIASLIRNARGVPIYRLYMIEDVSDRRRDAAKIERLSRDLEQRAVDLDTKTKEIDTFAHSVSHDLRAPLRAIDGFSRDLLTDQSSSLSADGVRWLGRIGTAAARMGELIDGLLELARVARVELSYEELDVAILARERIDELRRAEPGRTVEFVAARSAVCSADRRLLVVLLGNLLGNAWKFTRKRAAARVEFGETEIDGKRVFFVRDDGIGFDMHYAEQMFRPFHRVHGPSESEGSGVGLAAAERIVARHGGQIWARGAVDEGATIYFTLGALLQREEGRRVQATGHRADT